MTERALNDNVGAFSFDITNAITPQEVIRLIDQLTRQISRVDPDDCGCTYCVLGYSAPLNRADPDELLALLTGELVDATSASAVEIYDRFTQECIVHGLCPPFPAEEV